MSTPPPKPFTSAVHAPRTGVCCYFLQGTCRNTGRCLFSHTDSGQECQYGAACRHGHKTRPSPTLAPTVCAPPATTAHRPAAPTMSDVERDAVAEVTRRREQLQQYRAGEFRGTLAEYRVCLADKLSCLRGELARGPAPAPCGSPLEAFAFDPASKYFYRDAGVGRRVSIVDWVRHLHHYSSTGDTETSRLILNRRFKPR